MECHEFAAATLEGGASAPRQADPGVRLWFQPRRSPSLGVEWDLFHDDARVGSHARVGRAWMRGANGIRQAVAIKLRRDQPLGEPIDPDDASHRFWREHIYHQTLRDRNGQGTIPRVVVALEHSTAGDRNRPDSLPPAVVCQLARHALPLRIDGGLLIEGEARGFERRLVGDHGGPSRNGRDRGFLTLAHHRHDVLNGTLGQDDSACAGCPLRDRAPDACRPHVVFENFYPNEFLLLPVWDLSLEEYLGRTNSEARLADPRRHLVQRLAAAHDLALGLRDLHEARIWHHDLNPENILLRRDGSRYHAAIIDLGLSAEANDRGDSHPTGAGDASNLWPRRLSYAAWECRLDALEEPVRLRATWIEHGRAVFDLTQSALNWLDFDPPVCPGDRLVRIGNHAGPPSIRVLGVERGEGTNLLVFDDRDWPDREPAEFLVERQRGPAADLCSLGMVMIALLLDHPQGRPIRRELEHAQSVVADLAAETDVISPFELGTALLTHNQAFSATGKRFFHGRLARYGPYERLARRALGLAFSLALRGPARCGTVTLDRRITDAQPALERVCKLLVEIYDESRSARSSQTERSRLHKPRVVVAPRRRGDESLPRDWLQFLPFWQILRWDGSSQERLLQALRDGRLEAGGATRDVILEFLATDNAIGVIRGFLVNLVQFRERRPTGLLAWLFRSSERQMPENLVESLPGALAAVERLRQTARVGETWVKELRRSFRLARDGWLGLRSPSEATYLEQPRLDALQQHWETRFPKAFLAWREDWHADLDRLNRTLESIQAWWPVTGSRRMTDAHLTEATARCRELLRDVLPSLSKNALGPPGDVRASGILHASNSRPEPSTVTQPT